MRRALVEAGEHRLCLRWHVRHLVVIAHERLHRVQGVEPHQGHELHVVVSLAPDQVDGAERGNALRLDSGDDLATDDALVSICIVLRGPAPPQAADHAPDCATGDGGWPDPAQRDGGACWVAAVDMHVGRRLHRSDGPQLHPRLAAGANHRHGGGDVNRPSLASSRLSGRRSTQCRREESGITMATGGGCPELKEDVRRYTSGNDQVGRRKRIRPPVATGIRRVQSATRAVAGGGPWPTPETV